MRECVCVGPVCFRLSIEALRVLAWIADRIEQVKHIKKALAARTLDETSGGDELAVAVGSQDDLVVGLGPLAPGIHDANAMSLRRGRREKKVC